MVQRITTTHKTIDIKTVEKMIKSAAIDKEDFNLQVEDVFYYAVDGWFYKLRHGELIPEQWNGTKWIQCGGKN